MPSTTTQKTMGAMIILISLMNPSPSGFSACGEVRPYGADDDAQYKGHDDLEEKGLVERLAPGGLNRAVICHLSAFPVSLR